MNPTWDVLEQRVAQLEGGIAALVTASGQAAVTYSVLNVSRAGDNIIALSTAVRRHLQPVRAHAAAVRDRGAVGRPGRSRRGRAAGRRQDAAVFAETIGNPRVNVIDVEAWAAAAHARGCR